MPNTTKPTKPLGPIGFPITTDKGRTLHVMTLEQWADRYNATRRLHRPTARP